MTVLDVIKASLVVPCNWVACAVCSLGCFLHLLGDLVSEELETGFAGVTEKEPAPQPHCGRT